MAEADSVLELGCEFFAAAGSLADSTVGLVRYDDLAPSLFDLMRPRAVDHDLCPRNRRDRAGRGVSRLGGAAKGGLARAPGLTSCVWEA